MICPRPHCHGLLLHDRETDEWVCKSCARRWTEEKLRFAVRTGQVSDQPPPEEPKAREKTLAELLEDTEDEDQKDTEPQEAAMSDRTRCRQPWGRGTCKADAEPGSPFCAEHRGGREAEEPKSRRAEEKMETPAAPGCGRL